MLGNCLIFNFFCSTDCRICLQIQRQTKILCNFAVMTLLADEIRDFLCANAFDCVAEARCGVEVLSVGRKCVVPWDVQAENQEQAREDARTINNLLAVLSQEGSAAVIITEDRWRRQPEMMKARLLAHLEIFIPMYARNCEVRKIDKETAAAFLSENHSYGDAACRYRYGLYLKRYTGRWLEISRLASLARNDSVGSLARNDSVGSLARNASGDSIARNDSVDSLARNDSWVEPGSLVAVATFSNARKWQKGEKTIRSYEWTRYASLPGVRINGGMGKMLKAFIDDVHPDDVMSYADLEWSEGAVYEQLGFRLEGVKDPVLFCVDGQWGRSPVKPGMTGTVRSGMTGTIRSGMTVTIRSGMTGTVRSGMTGIVGQEMQDVPRYFQNLGSNKYRLKITEYE